LLIERSPFLKKVTIFDDMAEFIPPPWFTQFMDYVGVVLDSHYEPCEEHGCECYRGITDDGASDASYEDISDD